MRVLAVIFLILLYSSPTFAQSKQDSLDIRNILMKTPEYLESGDILSLAELCTDDFVERDIYPDGSRLIIVGKKNLIKVHGPGPGITNLFYNVKKMQFKKDKSYVTGEFLGDGVKGTYSSEFVKKEGIWLLFKITNYHEH